MEICSLSSNEAQPSKVSFPPSNPEDPRQYAHYSHRDCGSALAERRSLMAASNLILSRKRSIRSLVSEQVQNAQASDARPPSPSRPSKRTKEPRTPLSPAPQHLRDHESADDPPRPLLQSLGPAKAYAEEQEACINYQSQPASLRTLSSPIKFEGSLESFGTKPDQDSMDYSALGDQSKYLYYPPINSSEGVQPVSRLHDSGLYRRLSYGEPPSSPDWRVFHKTTGSRDLRRKARLHVKDNNYFSLDHQSPEAIQAKTWNSESSQPKPKLSLDLAEGEEIEEMVSLISLPNQQTCSPLRC